MKGGRLAIPVLAALALAPIMAGVARAGGDHECHRPGYQKRYAGYHYGCRDHGHRYDGYGHGTPGTGERESSRRWKDPAYGTDNVGRSARSLVTDFPRRNQRVYRDRYLIPPGHQPPPGDCGLIEGLIL